MPKSDLPWYTGLIVELGSLFLQIGAIVGFGILAASLPILLGLCLFAFLLGAIGLTSKLKLPRVASRLSLPLLGTTFGLAGAVGRMLPGSWGIATAAPIILAGFWVQSSFERKLGLQRAQTSRDVAPELELPFDTTPKSVLDLYPIVATSSQSAYHPVQTQEGDIAYEFDWWEMGMGGPETASYLFPDGVVLTEVGREWKFQDRGRYFAYISPSRENDSLVIYDRHQKRIHYCSNHHSAYRIKQFDGEALLLQSRYTNEPDRLLALSKLCEDAESFDMIEVDDIWVESYLLKRLDLDELREHAAPVSPYRLTSKIFLPPSLRALKTPLRPLTNPRRLLSMNGENTHLLLDAYDTVRWNESGTRCLCKAISILSTRPGTGYWCWEESKGWEPFPGDATAREKEFPASSQGADAPSR